MSSGSDVVPAAASFRWPEILMLVTTMALWGGTWPVGRAVSQEVDPWTAAFLRFSMASAALSLTCIAQGGFCSLRVPLVLLPRLLILAATGIFGYSFLFFSGLQTTDASRAGLIVGFIPASITLFASLLARQMPRGRALLGILISLTGVWVILSRGDPLVLLGGDWRPGDLMILGCVFCWTAYTLAARKVMNEVPPLAAVTWSCLMGTVLLLVFAQLSGLGGKISKMTGQTWIGLVYLGVPATSLAYWMYYRAIRRVGGAAAGLFINLVPLFALLFSRMCLGESLGASEMVGGLLVIAGVMMAMRARVSSQPG